MLYQYKQCLIINRTCREGESTIPSYHTYSIQLLIKDPYHTYSIQYKRMHTLLFSSEVSVVMISDDQRPIIWHIQHSSTSYRTITSNIQQTATGFRHILSFADYIKDTVTDYKPIVLYYTCSIATKYWHRISYSMQHTAHCIISNALHTVHVLEGYWYLPYKI